MSKRLHRNINLEPTLGDVDAHFEQSEINLRKPVRERKVKVQNEPVLNIKELELKKPAIVFASLMLLLSGVIFCVDQLFNPDRFEIEELRITADYKQLDPREMNQQILPLIENNYFAVDLQKIEKTIKEIQWVDQVSVRRQWPRSIYIRLTEQQPIARWGDEAYLNSRAEPFTVAQVDELESLPYLHGPNGTEQEVLDRFFIWKKQFDSKNLKLESLSMTDRYSYEATVSLSIEQQKELTEKALTTIFEDKKMPLPIIDWHQMAPFSFVLNLGKEVIDEKVSRFLHAFPNAFDEHLLSVKMVDLRYPNGFAIRWKGKEMEQDFLQLALTINKNVNE